MNKQSYLMRLEGLLSGKLSPEELRDALDYYNEYIEEAGPEGEAQAMDALGTPEAVAQRLLEERGGQSQAQQRPTRRMPTWGKVLIALLVAVAGVFTFGLRQTAVQQPHGTGVLEVTAVPPAPSTAPAGQTAAPLAFQNLSVDISIGTVRIQRGSEYGITLTAHGEDRNGTPYALEHSVIDGTLSVWSTPQNLSGGDRSNPGGTVVITIPEDAVISRADICVGMGDIRWPECTLDGALFCETGMGDITVKGALAGDVELESGMGSLTCISTLEESSYTCALEVGLGNVRVKGEKQGDGMGSDLQWGEGAWSISMVSGMGDVDLDFKG